MYLRAVNFNVLKDASLSDVRQAPAAAATVKAYLQSGVVEIGTTVDVTPTVVTLLGAGRIEAGDTVWLNGDSTLHMTCTSVSSTSITLNSTTGTGIPVLELDRLVPTTSRPVLYQDPFGTTPVDPTDSQIVIDSSGEGVFYCPETLIDVQISGAGLTTEWHWDVEAGEISTSFPVINVNAFLGESDPIQAAIDAVPLEGARVLIPRGVWTRTTPLYTPVDRPMILEGDSPCDLTAGEEPGTIIRWTTNVDMLAVRGNHQIVRYLILDNTSGAPSVAESEGYGIRISRWAITDPHPAPGTSTTATEYAKGITGAIRQVTIEDVYIIHAPGFALYIPGKGFQSDGVTAEDNSGGVSHAFEIQINRCHLQNSRAHGLIWVGGGCTTTHFNRVMCFHQGATSDGNDPTFDAWYAHISGTYHVVFDRCTFEGKSPNTYPWVRIHGTVGTQFTQCWWEDARQDAHTPTYFLETTGSQQNRGFQFLQNHLVRSAGAGGLWHVLKCTTGIRNALIGMNDGQNAGQTRSAATYPSGTYTNTDHFSLNTTSENVTVLSDGHYADNSAGSIGIWPFSFVNVPSKSTVINRLGVRVPGAVYTELGGSFGFSNGNIVMDYGLNTIASGGVGVLEYYWGGSVNGGLRLINNAPSLTDSERDTRASLKPWIKGDIIWNLSSEKVQIYGTVAGVPGWINLN